MPRTYRSASSTLSVSLCLAISYSLILTTLCAPFVIRTAQAATRSSSSSAKAAKTAPTLSSSLAARTAKSSPSSAGNSNGNNKSSGHRDGELIVRFRATTSEADKTSIAESRGAHRQRKLRGQSNIEKLIIPANQDAETLAAELRTNPNIEFVEPNYLVSKDDTTPNDPSFAQQWALHNSLNAGADIGVMPAWDTTTGSSSTVIAVIDSGIDFTHPDLANNEWTNTGEKANNNKDDDHDGFIDDVHGWDYITDNATIKDEQGHGTAIAGIIASEGNNGAGTSGVMWHASLMSLRVLDNTGGGDVATAVEAIDYAAAHGASVINLSWGTDAQSIALSDAIERAGRRGVVVVCSAGNGGRDVESTPYYPASFGLPNMVSVAATDNSDQLTSWSNYGSAHVTIAAPGVDIQTTKMNGGYWTVSGTSASAPFVAGVAGLIRTVRPQLSSINTVQAISSSARQVSALTGKVSAGGIVNAANALAALQNMDTAPAGYGNNGNGNGSNAGGNGNNGNGNNGGNNGNAGGNAHQPQPPSFSGHGGGGHGANGGFDATPPPSTNGAPGPNLPTLNPAHKPAPIAAKVPIHSDLLPMCDVTCGGEVPSGGAGGNDPYLARARSLPKNQTGPASSGGSHILPMPTQEGSGTVINLGSQNVNWGLPLVGLKGRSGLDLGISLFYNSLVWTKQDSSIMFNADQGFPGPGFQLGFPTLQPRYIDSQTGGYAYTMVTASGGRIMMRDTGAGAYLSQDSAYTELREYGGYIIVRTTDGTQYLFYPSGGNGNYHCTQIKDRNGNFITINYNGLGRPSTVIDTLGRTVSFNYDNQNYLISISQTWNGATHNWARFGYGDLQMQASFPGINVIAPANGTTIPVLTQVIFTDNSSYTFNYTSYGQINRFNSYAPDGHLLAYTSYNMQTGGALADCPRFSERRDWAQNTNFVNGVAAEAVTAYAVDTSGNNGWTQVTYPDGTKHKETFATSGWQTGLPTGTEEYDAANALQKWTTTTWTSDNQSASYQINPRPTDTNIYDANGNHKHTHIDYSPYSSYMVPTEVKEYDNDGTTVLRRTHTDYRWDQPFLDHYLIGLVSMVQVYDGGSTTPSAKTEYHYDWDSDYMVSQGAAVQHDEVNYPASFAYGRGNMTGIRRWNVFAPNDDTQAIWTSLTGYNSTGSPYFLQDHLGHQVRINYGDSFSDGNNNRNTLAYPTQTRDADFNWSYAQYDYDMGAVTRMQSPPAAGQTEGAVQVMFYESMGRIQNLITHYSGADYAYKRFYYETDGLQTYTYETVNNLADDSYTNTVTNGAGQLRAIATKNPGSQGGFRTQYMERDAMGRVIKQTNPTEADSGWNVVGDDWPPGYTWTLQAYDWKGRPTVTTNPDGSTTETTYGGCGCAGGEVSTVRDERGRRKKMTADVLGRLKEVVELQWDGTTPYSTTTYTYNALDQITQINQQGQLRTMDYDGHGRLWHRTTPEQGQTTYIYKADDTVQTITDARQAVQTFQYNNRHQVTSIAYTLPGSNIDNVVATSTVSYGYDAAGNRTSMTDGQGSTSYNYDQLSRLQSEQRTFSGLGQTYTLSYQYNRAGEVTNVTSNPWNVQVGYTYDQVGRPTGVTGANYGNVPTYASNFGYRAFGMKAMTYGNGRQLAISYDNRLRMTKWDVAGVIGSNYRYNNYSENGGRVTFAGSIYDTTHALDRAYNYDQVGRLFVARSGVEARSDSGQGWDGGSYGPYSHGFGYDVWGNMTHREGWGGWNASYDVGYTNNKRAGLTYDAAGNMKDDGGQAFTYDVNNKMVTSSWGLWQGYDGDGQRVQKQEGGQTTFYLHSSVLGGQVICEINGGGVWQKGYVYLGGQMLAIQQAGTVSYVHQDPVTKSQRLTDTSGNMVANATIELDPFGGETGAMANGSGKQSHVFTSYDRDGTAGMDEAGARKYHGWWSRFDQPDPYDGSYNIGDPQSFNRYSYSQNDPVNLVDPSGLDEEPVIRIDHWEPRDWPYFMPASQGMPLIIDLRLQPAPGSPIDPGDPPQNRHPSPAKKQKDPSDPECTRLAQRIANIQSDIISHASALVHNPGSLPDSSPSGAIRESVQGHRDRVIAEGYNLHDRIQEYKDKCGGGNPPTVPPVNAPRSYRNQSTNYPSGTFPRVVISLGAAAAAIACLAFWEVCLPAAAAGGAAVAH